MSTGATVSAVLFDLDGTILDTAPDLVYAANTALGEAGLPPRSAEALKPHISGGAAAMLRHALSGSTDRAEFERIHRRMLDIYRENLAEGTRFIEGIEAVLAELESRGIPWGIVTNKIGRFTDPLLDALSLSGRSGCVISGDTTPEKKPHPLPLLVASQRLGQAPECCVYVGDAARDMEAGRRAGMATLAALYGYIGSEDEPGHWGADGLLEKPGDLLVWLDERNPS